MPAVTPERWGDLPRLSAVDIVSKTERSVRSITTAPRGLEGEGFPVRRAFAGLPLSALDPFVHMDQMGEVDYAPGEPKGTPWHPHRGFETVTYMMDGTFLHQDSNGGGGVVENGATQWMTAGKGILHIETPPEELVVSGGLFHGIQLWVNLPAKDKMIDPAYQGLEAGDVTFVASPDAETLVRIIAGELGGFRGPGSTHSPMTMAHVSLAPGARSDLPWDPEFNALVYVLAGTGYVGSERHPIQMGQLASFGPGDLIRMSAGAAQDSRSANFEALVLGGRPIGEPVEHYGPFVMNTRAEIVQALEDFEAGRLGVVPANALMPHTPDPNPIRVEHAGI